MEDVALILTNLLNLSLIFLLALYFRRKIKLKLLNQKKAKWLYVFSALATTLLTSSIALVGFVSLFNTLGVAQEFGHPGMALGIVLSFFIGIIIIPAGIIVINWSPIKW